MAANLKIDVDLDTDGAERGARRNLNRAGKTGAAAFASGFKSNLGLITAAIAGVAAISRSINFFKESISAAAIQQQAINDLNTQLAITGQFTEQVSQDLQDFASSLQSTTRFGDEAILSQLAFAQALGATAEQSKDIVAAGADLAESLNIDLNSAVRNVGRTLGGFAGELGEVIPELKNLTTEQLQAGAAIDLLAQKFAGAAAGRVRTFAGATSQLSNVFGDFQETIGSVVVNSPAFVAVINTTTKAISRLNTSLSGISQDDPFANLLQGLVTFGRGVSLLIKPFEVFFNFLKVGFSALRAGIANIFLGIVVAFDNSVAPLLEKLSQIPGKFGKQFQNLTQDIKGFREAVSATAEDESFATFENLANIFETSGTDEAFRNLLSNYQAAIEKSREFKQETSNNLKGTADSAKASVDVIANVLKNGLVNVASQSLQALGQTLAGAGEGFKGFVGIVINALGDLAISLGTTIIASSKAIEALKAAFLGPLGSGVAAIGLGAALVAAGAALKVFGSSFGGGTTAAPSVGGFAGAAGEGIQTDDQFSQTPPDERAEPETRVQINIQGDVLDSDESALRIASLLEKAQFDNNVRVVGGLA